MALHGKLWDNLLPPTSLCSATSLKREAYAFDATGSLSEGAGWTQSRLRELPQIPQENEKNIKNPLLQGKEGIVGTKGAYLAIFSASRNFSASALHRPLLRAVISASFANSGSVSPSFSKSAMAVSGSSIWV